MAGVSAISEQVNITFIKLQERNLLISQQRQELDNLAAIICTQIVVEGPFTEVELNAVNKTTHITYSQWCITRENTINYLFDQGMFIQEIFTDKLSIDQQILVSNTVGKLVMQVVEGITNIQVERDKSNLPAEDQVPPVLPHELVKLKGRDFTSIVIKHLSRLKQFWTDDRISKLELQHHELLLLYQHNPSIRSELDKCDYTTFFQSGWAILEESHSSEFTILRDFCRGIASVFPNTATVESDFSILGWEAHEYRRSLTNLSLEGIMQCKQFKLLNSLSTISSSS